MKSQHSVDLGVLGVCTCDVESAVSVVRKQSVDNYDSVDIRRITVALGPVRVDVTPLISDEAVEQIREEILESLSDVRPTSMACATI